MFSTRLCTCMRVVDVVTPAGGIIAYYVAFGPHGPRTPSSKPGDTLKVFGYTMGLLGVTGIVSLVLHHFGTWSIYTLFFFFFF